MILTTGIKARRHKQPDDKRGANFRTFCQRESEERDQRHASHAVSFKTVRCRTDRVARVIARAIRDDAQIFRDQAPGSLKTIFIRSEPMSAILVKMPPQIRRTDAPRDSPIANPMKQGPTSSRGRNIRT